MYKEASLRKYKDNITDLHMGLDAVLRLRPVEFDWKDSMGSHDLGFVAEEVEAVNPLLAEYMDGELRSVKYSKLTALLTKAIQDTLTFCR